MKRTSRVLAILLALAMLLSVTAFATETAASWSVFGGNADHNAVVGKAPTTDVTVTALKLLKPDSGWDGVDTVPLMQTVGNVTYAYVLYDGHADGCPLQRSIAAQIHPMSFGTSSLRAKAGSSSPRRCLCREAMTTAKQMM